MSNLHVSVGNRTYLPEQGLFADVTRDHVLGLQKGCVVKSDDGKLRAFCGERVSSVVSSSGVNAAVPTDVKAIGPQILSSFGVNAVDQVALFQKFIVLEKSVRDEKAAFWELHQYDDVAMSTFIPEVIGILQSDDLYIQHQADKMLAALTTEVRQSMLQKMMQVTDEETRKGLIVRYTMIRNDRVQVEDFLQSIYSLLLDNDTYLQLEMRRALLTLKGTNLDEANSRIDSFLESSTELTRNEFVAHWRSMKYYTKAARRAGVRKVLHLLKKHFC